MWKEDINNNTKDGLNFKHKILALYQFFSTIGLILFLLGYSLIALKESPKNLSAWLEKTKEILIFNPNEHLSVGITSSLFVYVAIGFWLIANTLGLLMLRFKNRNLFDQLFLIFILLPVFSNFFALFSQMTTKKYDYTLAAFDKKKIIQDQTRIIKLNIKKAEYEKSERIKNFKLANIAKKKTN